MKKLISIIIAAAVMTAALPVSAVAEELPAEGAVAAADDNEEKLSVYFGGEQCTEITTDLEKTFPDLLAVYSSLYITEGDKFTFSIADESIATAEVYSTGYGVHYRIIGHKGGDTVMTVTSPGGNSVDILIHVNAEPYINIVNDYYYKEAGKEYLLIDPVQKMYVGVNMYKGDEPIRFSMKDESVAKVLSSDKYGAYIIGVSNGETELLAELPDGKVLSARVVVQDYVATTTVAMYYHQDTVTTAAPSETVRRYSTAEELKSLLVSPDGSFSGSEALDGTKYSADAKLKTGYNGNTDLLIVYGLDSTDQIGEALDEMSDNGYMWAGDPENYCGCTKSITSQDMAKRIDSGGNILHIMFFVKDQMPGFISKYDLFDEYDLVEATKAYGFDPSPYIFDEIIPGDTDGDKNVTANDASVTLAGYSELMTGADLQLNSTIFDYNEDGVIDAADGSEMLVTYADNMTSVK